MKPYVSLPFYFSQVLTSKKHFNNFADAINYITVTKKAYAILDPHNYMRYNDPSQQPMTGSVIGNSSDSKAATTAQFGAFWGELARRFVDNPKVIFGLMNEVCIPFWTSDWRVRREMIANIEQPHDIPTSLVLANDQAAIDAIRNAGAKQLIIAPGNSWTGGHSWMEGSDSSGATMCKIKDPLNNTAFDIHEYLDTDYSGSHQECVNLASTKLAPVTAWLKKYGFKAMITEFGASPLASCNTYVTDILNYMATNDVYIGWTAWAAGPMWGTRSPCCNDNKDFGSLEPGSTASDGSPGLYTTLWVNQIQKLLPTTLVWSGMSSVTGGM
jgi:endoglucanase